MVKTKKEVNIIMSREINKKQIKMASSGGKYVTKIEFFQELREIKKDVKEVKKILNNNKEKSVTQLYKVEARKEDAKITKLEVQEDKLIAQLSDSRELSIPISWFAKWGVKGVSADKLKRYEIWEGDEIYFPDINEVVGIESFTKGFDADCE